MFELQAIPSDHWRSNMWVYYQGVCGPERLWLFAPLDPQLPQHLLSALLHAHISMATHTRRETNASTHMYSKCFMMPCDLYTWHLFHGSSILRVSGLLWTQPWAVYQPWMTSLPVGSLTGVLASCLSDWMGVVRVVGWLTGFLAGKLVGWDSYLWLRLFHDL